ncbi:hypothetical protein [Marinobacter sp. F4206]|uniref:hypothetical protein n=1 Tax=Marinobacter sp. F4206 TaxID=2861777 RepID=UPI001C601EE8|nr:hypothetical protein [Marinobacter sp. F4206]MBW4934981.1 hypothetical protein [Marinobacter sp. F4206]
MSFVVELAVRRKKMKPLIILLLSFFIVGCDSPEPRVIDSEIVKTTTPDGVEIRKGEISEVMTSKKNKDRFVSYLQKNDIYYRLDNRYPNEVSWIPESEEHRQEIFKKAFSGPEG